jgi:hypothetical protein
MRRAALSLNKDMDAAQPPSIITKLTNSKIAKGLSAIPIINFGLNKAKSTYSTIKEFNVVTGTSLTFVENATGAVVLAVGQNRLTQKGLDLVGNQLEALDTMAARRLADLETKVPAINTQPEQVIPAVRGTVMQKVDYVRERVTKSTDWVLSTKIAGKGLEAVETILRQAASAVDKVLPPKEGEKKAGATLETPPASDQKTARGLWLLTSLLAIMTITKDRLLDNIRTRVINTTTAAETAIGEAKVVVCNALPGDKKEVSGGSGAGAEGSGNGKAKAKKTSKAGQQD